MQEGLSFRLMRSLLVLLAALAVVGCTTRDYYAIVSSGKLICGTKFDVRGFGFKGPGHGRSRGSRCGPLPPDRQRLWCPARVRESEQRGPDPASQ